MSDRRGAPTTGAETEGRRLSIQVPPDHRFRVVVETALRIYLRPICHGPETAPQLAGELAAMIDEVAGQRADRGRLQLPPACPRDHGPLGPPAPLAALADRAGRVIERALRRKPGWRARPHERRAVVAAAGGAAYRPAEGAAAVFWRWARKSCRFSVARG